MATADYVVLFTLREDVGMLKLPVAMLHEMQKQSQTNRDDGRWCVAVDWLPESNGFCATLAPIHAPHLKANVYDHLVPGPETSLSDWYHTAHRS